MTTPDVPSDHATMHHILRRLKLTVPPWGVSLAFHAVLILLVVWLVPTEPRVRSAPGYRVTENVGIVFAPGTSGSATPDTATHQGQSDLPQSQSVKSSVSDTSIASIVSSHLAELTPPRSVTPYPLIGHSSPTPSTGSPNADRYVSGGAVAGGTAGGGVGTGDGAISGSFMGAEGTGRKFVYVLDRSMSTGYGQRHSLPPLVVAKTELLASLQSIGDAGLRESKPIQFQVIFFNHNTAVFNTVGFGGSDQSGRLLRYDKATFDKLQRFLGGIINDGGTKPEPALMQAVRMGADCIFFMTDGGTQLNPAELQRIRQSAKGVQINVVEYGTGTRATRGNSLRQLAEENHGNHVYVDLTQRSR